MKKSFAGAIALANIAAASPIEQVIAVVNADDNEINRLEHGSLGSNDFLAHKG